MQADDRARILGVRRHIDVMIADPFGGQVLRDFVPKGSLITPALAEEAVLGAVRRAIAHSRGTPAFLAVDQVGRQPTLLKISRGGDGRLRVVRPGDWREVKWDVATHPTLGQLIALLQDVHNDD
jgi:hypothetical protein